MADKDTSGEGPKPTESDNKFLRTIAKYVPKDVQIDWEKFTEEMKLKNVLVAKTRFRQIRSKLGLNEPADDPSQQATQTTSKKSTKVTAKATMPSNANKVTKSRKQTRGKKSKQASQPVADAAETDEMIVDAEDDEI
ncbi:hypothetical protein F5Y19DRAFT_477222 [Xylariaceae sp. FL1651]|nr:hypothetical protein F5Y19DRAFT_477222 [Xylariaceae sp. FL1651]